MAFTQRNRRQTRPRRSGAYVSFTASNTDYTLVADNTIARFNASAPNVTWRKYDGYIHQIGEQVTHDNPYSADIKGIAGFDSRMRGLRHISPGVYAKSLDGTLNIRRLAMGGGGNGGPSGWAGGGGGSGGAAFDSSNLSVTITGNAHRIKDQRLAGIVKAEMGAVANVGSAGGDSSINVTGSDGIAGSYITGGGGAGANSSDPLGSGGGGTIPGNNFQPGSNISPAGTGGPQGGDGAAASGYPGCGDSPSSMRAGGGGGIGPNGTGSNGSGAAGGAGTDLYTLIHPGKSGLTGGGGGGGGANGPNPYTRGDGYPSCPGRGRGTSTGNSNVGPQSPSGGGATGSSATANTGGGGGGGGVNRYSQGNGGTGVVLLRLF